jgi:cytochrome c assembly protein
LLGKLDCIEYARAGRYCFSHAKPMTTRLLGYISLITLAVATYGIFFVAGPISGEGDAGRIIYFHVPMAWVAFLAFFVVLASSVAYLMTRHPRWDRVGRASAEVGLVFTTLVLITGSIWGYPIWGTWWSWDPKLTTTLVLWFMYLAYLMVRSYAEGNRGHHCLCRRAHRVHGELLVALAAPAAGHRSTRRSTTVGHDRVDPDVVAACIHGVLCVSCPRARRDRAGRVRSTDWRRTCSSLIITRRSSCPRSASPWSCWPGICCTCGPGCRVRAGAIPRET